MLEKRDFGVSLENWTAARKPQRLNLQGRFVSLEPLDCTAHVEDLFVANKANDLIWDYLPYGPFENIADYSAWVASVENRSDPFFYAVRDLKSGKALGVMSYLRVAPDAGSIEVGHINFSTPLQKTAAATEAVFLMMKWAFEAGYRRFEWKCDAMNLGSRAAAQRFGFSYEGVFRQAGVVKGRNRDTAWFACIDAEWPALETAYERWLRADNFDVTDQQVISLGDLTRATRVADDPVLAG